MHLLVLLILSFSPIHDVALAKFNIEQEDGFLSLNVKLDKEDLENIYQKNNENSLDLTKETDLIQQYLDKHFYLVVNEQKINFKVDLISQNNYFYHVQLSSLQELEETIRHIQLKNTCLIETVEGHSNIVNFRINEKLRSFRMHETRKRIEVKY